VKTTITFSDAVKRLADFGIKEEQVYLIDLILLVGMAWADNRIQKAEVDILHEYLKVHVKNINKLAGCRVLSEESAIDFIDGLLQNRPSQEMLSEIERIIVDIRIGNKIRTEAAGNRMAILNGCLDIAASSVAKYPYDLTDRFTMEEKTYYHKIQKMLGGKN
jgi:hypothetical protein